MSDFFQTGAIATLHRLGRPNVQRLEQELENFSLETPMALVLPCHIKELGTSALKLIVRELKNVTQLIQEAMNLALEEDLEKRGLKFARPTQKLFSQEGGVSCA